MKETKIDVRELKTHLDPAASLEKKLQQLVDSGILAWDGQKLPLGDPVVFLRGDRLVSDLLIEDRD